MNNIVKVQNHDVAVIEWNNERVVTSAQLAELYETNEENIRKNLSNNQGRFEEGKHFYLLKGDELKAFKDCVNNLHVVSERAPQLYLWTQRGASRHCKMLGTDKSWDVFDCLEESYFNPKQKPSSPMEILKLEFEALKEIDGKVDKVNADLQNFKQDIPLFASEGDEITKAARAKGIICLGGKKSAAYNDNSIRSKVYSDIYRQLHREFGVTKYNAIRRRDHELALKIISEYGPPYILQEEISLINQQVVM